MVESVAIEHITHFGSGFAGCLSIQQGTTLRQFLQEKEVDPDVAFVLVNGLAAEQTDSSPFDSEEKVLLGGMDYVLREGDRVSVTPRSIEGAWLPQMKLFKRYLTAQGFHFDHHGAHEVWVDDMGQKISLNTIKRNKEVDPKCLDRLAEIRGVNRRTIVQEILDFRDRR